MVGYETFDPILCLTISGKQDIRLKLKQSEQIFGPKVKPNFFEFVFVIKLFEFRLKLKHIVVQLIVY
jgi:hypothetical protein